MEHIEQDNIYICTISTKYFDDFPEVRAEALDKDKRYYLAINVKINDLNFVIPFRSNLNKHRKLKKANYPLPTDKRPNRGLDFAKCLLITDPKYINKICRVKSSPLSSSEQNRLINKGNDIINRFRIYFNSYLTSCAKGRENREPEFKFSTLHFYKDILKSKGLF